MASSSPDTSHSGTTDDSILVSTISPVHAVLRTTELLELILLQVDQRSLLTSAQRTCRGFYDLVCTSPCLQAHLFFSPRRADLWDGLQMNPLIGDVLPVRLSSSRLMKKGRRFYWDRSCPDGPDVYQSHCESHSLAVCATPSRCKHQIDAAFCRPDASWRRMLLVQPVLMPKDEDSLCNVWSKSSYPDRTDVVCLRRMITSEPLTRESFLFGHETLFMAQLLAQARAAVNNKNTYCIYLQADASGPVQDPTSVKINLDKRTVRTGSQMVYLQAEFHQISRSDGNMMTPDEKQVSFRDRPACVDRKERSELGMKQQAYD
ncbi:hypothetical protein BJ166DRAFT_112663 [Pestalotiopsis sp. NC0098]|nr:hypothetical protein BJ166DRAFT_112663 [Pestalotiopsis sp. NC0098]